MKPKRLYLLVLLLLASVLLSSCSGAVTATSWPGVTSDQDTIYVSYQTAVFAVRASDGSMIWRYPEKPDNAKLFYAPPALSSGNVVVGSYHNIFYALDPSNGKEKWAFNDAKGRYVGGALPTADLTLAPSVDKNLYALSPEGQLRWKFTTGNGLWSAPVSDTKNAYQVSMDHSIYAVDLASGKQVWKTDLGGAAVDSPTLTQDGIIYIGTLKNEVVAVNSADGSIVWRYKTSDAVWSQPVVSDGAVFFGDLKGYAYAVDAKTGAEKWKSQLSGAIIGAAAVMPEGLVFGTDQGNLQAFGFDGKKLWTRTINGKLYSNLVFTNNRIVAGVVGGDHLLITFDANGNEGWSFAVPK